MTALHALAPGVAHPAPLGHSVSPAIVMAGLFAAPLAWSLQLIISYLINGDSCHGVLATAPNSPIAYAAMLVVSVLALLAALAGLAAARHIWRVTRREGPDEPHQAATSGQGRTRFLGLCGIVASSIFLVAIVFEGLVPFLVSSCTAP